MSFQVVSILGDAGEPRFSALRHDRVEIAWFDASKPRLSAQSEGGETVKIELPRGSYLAAGSVLFADEAMALVVSRTTDQVCSFKFDEGIDRATLLADAVRLGHALGSQHLPFEMLTNEIVVPVASSAEVLTRSVQRLGLRSVSIRFTEAEPFANNPPQQAYH